MRYKRGLVQNFGFYRASSTYAVGGLVRDSGQIQLYPLTPLREHLRTAGTSYEEWHAGGEPFAIPAPRIVNDFPSRPLEFVSRGQDVGSVADALVRGRSSLVVAGGKALLDFEPHEAALFDVELDIDPAVFSVDGNKLWVPVPAPPDEAMQVDEAYSLLGPQTGAFGDWMYQTLPRYVAADASGLLPIVPVLVDADLPTQILDSLQAVLRPGVQVIHVPSFRCVRVRRLWCSPSLHYAPAREVMDHRYKFDYSSPAPSLFLPTVQEISRRVPTPASAGPTPPRVFLARKPGLWRRMVNDEAIERIAREHGLAVVYPEELSFAQQVALIRGATHVVAPEGSALLLMYFARPGARLCILNHQNFETTAYDDLLDGVDLQVILGPFVDKDPQFELRSSYRIDEGVFARFLDGWLA
jgi:capsular polysaccharide biosynthesis protein